MGMKKMEQDLRDAGLRKKRARKVAKAADRARAGDEAARQLVDLQSAALRDSVSAVVRYAKPPKSAAQTAAKRPPTKRTATARPPARSTAKSTAAKKPKAGTGRSAAT